ncbi:MAG: hypothetical protein ACR2HJ_10795 [Fimbriimonadales bacterium]
MEPVLPFVSQDIVDPNDVTLMPDLFGVLSGLEFYDSDSESDPPEVLVFDRFGRQLNLKIDIHTGLKRARLGEMEPAAGRAEWVEEILSTSMGHWTETTWQEELAKSRGRERQASCLPLLVVFIAFGVVLSAGWVGVTLQSVGD